MSITIRPLKFDFSDSIRYYYKDSKFVTHFMNALSSTFPAGETFFVKSVRKFRKPIKDELEINISKFIGQESYHSLAHQVMNEYAQTQNIPLKTLEEVIDKALLFVEKHITTKQCLAVTIALEHYTACMGKELQENPKWLDNLVGKYQELWDWHSLEEMEHKAVAYDVYVRENFDYKTRALAMIGASVIFWIVIMLMTFWLMYNDDSMSTFVKIDEIIYGLIQLFGFNGFVTNIFKDIPIYFRTDFHPNMIE